jgi:hypothetical protein
VDASPLKAVWLLPPVLVGLFYLHTAWSWLLGGAIAFVAGTLVALDYRGVAARIPAQVTMKSTGADGEDAGECAASLRRRGRLGRALR